MFRLYKLARNKIRAPLKEEEGRPADLESLFFDSEVGYRPADLESLFFDSEVGYRPADLESFLELRHHITDE